VKVTPFSSAKGIFIEFTLSSGVMIVVPINIALVIPGWSEGPDRRCAIAHLRFALRARPGMTVLFHPTFGTMDYRLKPGNDLRDSRRDK
jgi:hypothetical protein